MPYHEDDRFGVRSIAKFRDRFIRGIPASPGSDLRGNQPTLYVDASASYGMTRTVQRIVEATSVTDERNVPYIDSVRQDMLFETRTGRTLSVGAHLRF